MNEAAQHHWPLAPNWAVSAGPLGKGLILAALACFLWTIVGWLLEPKKPAFAKSAKWTLVAGGLLLLGTFIDLGILFANNQFEYTYVFSHGDADTELKYKIAGIWAGQQGSFLLWALTSSLFAILVAPISGQYRRWFSVVYAVFLAMLCSILTYETPFEMARLNGLALQPPQGAGLVPSLQNYWIVIHPPTIFTGFGSLTVPFALGLAAMFTGNIKDWVPIVRPWVILSAALTGLGLCMGGFWAYETLGWGGFWQWDPVENVSFVPWIFSAALLHGLIVQTTKNKWFSGNLVMAGLPFLLFSYGTFLTRSGFLANASNHSFVEMNRSALWILAIFVGVAVIGYYVVYGVRGAKLAKAATPPEANEGTGLGREAMYQSGVLLLCGLAATIAVGMSVPFFLAVANKPSKVVEEPLYHLVVVWFFLPIMLLMGIAPFVSWRKLPLGLGQWSAQFASDRKPTDPSIRFWTAITNVLLVTIGVLGLSLIAVKFSPPEFQPLKGSIVSTPFHKVFPLVPWMLILIAVCIFAFIANLWRALETFKRSKLSIGGFVSHMGVAILMGGLVVSRGFQRDEKLEIQEGTIEKALGYDIDYRGITNQEEGGVFKRDNKALFEVKGPGGEFTARVGFYAIPGQDKLQWIVWPHIEHMPTYDIYMEMYEPIFDVWEEPQEFNPGETRQFGNDMSFTYNGFKMEGQPGQIGTKFIGDAIVRITGRDGVTRSHEVHPALQLTDQGMQNIADQVDSTFSLVLVGMDAGTKAGIFQLELNQPMYPMQIFYKPMAGLVWLGAGVTALGGFLAAYYRRPTKRKLAEEISEPTSDGT